MPDAALVATLSAPPSPSGAEIEALPHAARFLEIRADRAGDLDPEWLRARFSGRLIYSLRSRREGGEDDGSAEERRARLLAAAERYDLVDLEAETDLSPALLAAIPADQRLISWQGPGAPLAELRGRLDRMSSVAARFYRVAPAAEETLGALAPLHLLRSTGRRDLVAYATGRAGAFSRVLARALGAPLVFGGAGALDKQSGELDVAALAGDYGLPLRQPVDALFGIAGMSVMSSLSPRLHNAAYRALGLHALYLPFYTERFEAFFHEAVLAGFASLGTPLRGFTVTSPHKEAALLAASSASPIARRACSSNALFSRRGGWEADTTDAEGVVAPLLRRGLVLPGLRVAVVGCGGAGRVAAAALQEAGAAVTLINRGQGRGHFAADLLGLPFVPLADFAARDFELLVNATPRSTYGDACPFSLDDLDPGAAILDMAVGADPPPSAAAALEGGRTIIGGREVLLVEVARQFHLMTGRSMESSRPRALLDEDDADEGGERPHGPIAAAEPAGYDELGG